MKRDMPVAYREFEEVANLLEKHCRNMQDLEFTVEKGKLWMLQTRDGKRTAQAAVTYCRRYGRRGAYHS